MSFLVCSYNLVISNRSVGLIWIMIIKILVCLFGSYFFVVRVSFGIYDY